MESVGGIFKKKRFINRGFLIGPYCPVYGFGVILITILLQKYSNDIPALFVLATLICGTLEYATSYFMEKLFNARWWDYSKNKFNINGRVCLETLLPFGILGSIILCIVNPFLVKYISMLQLKTLSFISYGLTGIFIIDSIVSFIIINGFKNATYEFGDNTEEVSNKVKEVTDEIADKIKDTTEDVLMKASSDIIVLTRRMKVRGLKFGRNVTRYTSKKMSEVLNYSPAVFVEKLKNNRKLLAFKIREEKDQINNIIKTKKENLETFIKEGKENITTKLQDTKTNVDNKIKESKENITTKLQDTKTNVNNKLREGKENLNNKAQNIKLSSEEFTKQIKEKLMSKSIFHRRLLEAFPNLKTKMVTRRKATKKEKK